MQLGSLQCLHTIEACIEAHLLVSIQLLLIANVFFIGSWFCGTNATNALTIMAFPFYHATTVTVHLLHVPCSQFDVALSICTPHHTAFVCPHIRENNT